MQNVKKEMGKGTNAQLQRASDGYPFQFPHFTEKVWIKHPKPAQLSEDQMEEYAYKYLESSILLLPQPSARKGALSAFLKELAEIQTCGYVESSLDELLPDIGQAYFPSAIFNTKNEIERANDYFSFHKIIDAIKLVINVDIEALKSEVANA